MAYPDIGRGYRQNRRRRAAEKEEAVKKSKKATPRLHSPGARARAMSAAVGLDTSTGSPRRAAEKEEAVKKSKKATPRLHSPGARARAMSAAVGLDTSTDNPRRQSTSAGAGTRSGGVASRPERKMSVGMVAEKNPKSIAEARRMGSDTFIGKDGMKKAAVTKEELEASGYKTLREYLNAKNREKKKPAMKKGGKVPGYAPGGKVRGAGIAKRGVKPCKMR
jgi:hypothetical protein